MTAAEIVQKAKSLYPIKKEQLCNSDGTEYIEDDVLKFEREAYIKGYQDAIEEITSIQKDFEVLRKDYDRLEHDYSTCLWYFTDGLLSKTNYEIKTLETLILDTIEKYRDEGYQQAKRNAIKKAEEWIKQNCIWDTKFIEALRKEMEKD